MTGAISLPVHITAGWVALMISHTLVVALRAYPLTHTHDDSFVDPIPIVVTFTPAHVSHDVPILVWFMYVPYGHASHVGPYTALVKLFTK